MLKVYRNGELVEDAVVEFGADKQPEFVTSGGIRHHARVFTFEEAKSKKKAPARKVMDSVRKKSK